MGSEGIPSVTIHVTGFKKFHGVAENPTETIINNLKDYVKKNGLQKGVILGSCTILETAGQGAISHLYQTLQSSLSKDDKGSSNSARVIWVHFGVNSGATRFAIESQAVNEATFRCPDEMGWKPQKVPIIPADGGISRARETSLPAEEITKSLAKMGFEVMTSDDAGRFVCNYVYYHSLRFADQNGMKSLFVHVPLFFTIDEETQMQFAAALLEGDSRTDAAGCGKSTLLKVLAGRAETKNAQLDGVVMYNNKFAAEVSLSRIIAYISGQLDKHIPFLTVKETLEFARDCSQTLRPENFTPQMRKFYAQALVEGQDPFLEYILKILDLKSIEDKLAGESISDIDRQKLTIAELALGTYPVMLYDQPLSGSDTAVTYHLSPVNKR